MKTQKAVRGRPPQELTLDIRSKLKLGGWYGIPISTQAEIEALRTRVFHSGRAVGRRAITKTDRASGWFYFKGVKK